MSRPKGSKNKKLVDVPERSDGDLPIPEKIKEVIIEKEIIKEVIRTVPEPRLEGYFQGGMGQWMEDPNGTERVYVPHVSEVYGYFIGDPEKWEQLKDHMIRAYLELQ